MWTITEPTTTTTTITPPPPPLAMLSSPSLPPFRLALQQARGGAVWAFGDDAMAERIVDTAVLLVLVVATARVGASFFAAVTRFTDNLLHAVVKGLAFVFFVRLCVAAYATTCQERNCSPADAVWRASEWASGVLMGLV